MPVEGPRALAFETLRETFERHAHTELVFRAGAERLGLVGRDRAQAQRLAYGSVQRRGTSDAAIEKLSGRAMRLLDPPVAAALRLGLYELLFADGTPDHAAVDQAVELVKIAKAGHASGFVNAILRRAAREREVLTADLLGDDSTPEAAATAHSAPLWLARMWWEELGPEAARALLAACNEPAEVAMRAADADARADLVARLRGEGVDVSPAGGGWPLAVPEAMVFAGRLGDLVPILVKEGALTPQSRGSAAVVEALAPRAGETVLDLCAGPGIKTGQIAKRMEDRGEIISVELDEKRAAEIAAQSTR
ncbi:MAG TPA: transcription antitermination factor NusB, partial [Solirubrobacterales bacterium]|nr:transcription antitermination factor NusB [Solirubrobacterales bacterium]